MKAPLIAALCIVAACAPALQPAPNDPDASERMLQQAATAIANQQPAVAEELLIATAREHPDTPAALEVPYWRAIIRLDPSSPHVAPTDAIWLLDLYLSSEVPVQRRAEARALRRAAIALDSLQRAVVHEPPPPPEEDPSLERALERQRELERENARLRESLEKTTAELERIRRRLAAPPP